MRFTSIETLIFNLRKRLNLSGLLKRLLRGAFWSVLGTATTRAFSLITNIGIARLLGREDFGVYGIILSTLGTFGLFGGLAFGYSMIKFTAQYAMRDPDKAGRLISGALMMQHISAGILTLTLVLSSDYLARGMLNRPALGDILPLGALYLFVRTINNCQLGTLIGLGEFSATARINVVAAVMGLLVTLPLVFFLGLVGAMIALTLETIINYIYCAFVLKRKCAEHRIVITWVNRGAWREMREVLSFSIPAFMSGLLLMPVSWLTNALLVNQPEGYAQLGLFNAANQWRQFILLIPSAMSAVMLAISADTYADGPDGSYRRSYQINVKLSWAYALPVAAMVITFGEPLNHLFGSRYAEAASMIPPIIAAAFFSVINTVASNTVAAAGRMWAEVGLNLLWAALITGFSLWLVPAFGAMGLAYASLIAAFGQAAARLLYIELVLLRDSLNEFQSLAFLSLITLGVILFLTATGRFNLFWGLLMVVVGSMPLLKKAREMFKADTDGTVSSL